MNILLIGMKAFDIAVWKLRKLPFVSANKLEFYANSCDINMKGTNRLIQSCLLSFFASTVCTLQIAVFWLVRAQFVCNLCAISCKMKCVSEPRFVFMCFENGRASSTSKKETLLPLSFEGKFGEDEKLQALKQRLHSAKQTLGLHRNMDCCLPCSTCWKVNNTTSNMAP